MAWRQVPTIIEQRIEFARRALRRQESMSALCAEAKISRPTGYYWLRQFVQYGTAGLANASRRPQRCPRQTPAEMEARVVALRRQRPDWGARKLKKLLRDEGVVLPVTTVHRILLRGGLVREQDRHAAAPGRFQRSAPNQLWQMDFKSPKGCGDGVGPLSVLDDCSRYVIVLAGPGSTQSEWVRARLEAAFRQCGVPDEMLMDHGVPWWNQQACHGWTRLTIWLMKQGIRCCFGRYRHPQTQGKVERFHGTLEAARRRRGLAGAELRQPWLDQFRHEYNWVRPHEALAMQTPASVWRPSPRAYNPAPVAWEYDEGVQVERVGAWGQLKVGERWWKINQALAGERVGLVWIEQRVLIYYCRTLVRDIDLAEQRSTAVDRCSLSAKTVKDVL